MRVSEEVIRLFRFWKCEKCVRTGSESWWEERKWPPIFLALGSWSSIEARGPNLRRQTGKRLPVERSARLARFGGVEREPSGKRSAKGVSIERGIARLSSKPLGIRSRAPSDGSQRPWVARQRFFPLEAWFAEKKGPNPKPVAAGLAKRVSKRRSPASSWFEPPTQGFLGYEPRRLSERRREPRWDGREF